MRGEVVGRSLDELTAEARAGREDSCSTHWMRRDERLERTIDEMPGDEMLAVALPGRAGGKGAYASMSLARDTMTLRRVSDDRIITRLIRPVRT